MSRKTENRLLMMLAAQGGATLAHEFIHECGARPLHSMQSLSHEAKRRIGKGCRIFVPPHNDCRVVMFQDKSGAYIHADFLVTFLDADISHEIDQWSEVFQAVDPFLNS